MSHFTFGLIGLCVLAIGSGLLSLFTHDRRLAVLSLVASLLVPGGGIGATILQLILAFRALGATPASEKAAVLSQKISEAMNSTTIGLGAAVPCLIVSVLAMVRAPKRAVQNASTRLRESV